MIGLGKNIKPIRGRTGWDMLLKTFEIIILIEKNKDISS